MLVSIDKMEPLRRPSSYAAKNSSYTSTYTACACAGAGFRSHL